MEKDYQTGPLSDNLLISLHLSFIIFSFSFALRAPFYFGFLLIFLHKAHEIYFGECYLTLLQQRYGYSGQNDDFFYHFFRRLNIEVKRKSTRNIHLAIKTIILLIVLFKTFNYFDFF
ncbi:hypothetical protein [Halanaerobium hydrogeniformans]|uniref:Uncharacterized protein n=1 Tax=Halanaerobium hydrogeniformans TaxID=656519 RepID=E4RNB8_HALHG|nr:hypothetical protein [Halanaerobium hydrogeniformans]ADQ13586.1 hypothetical protein Halsa_0095 [Halanaerobium hydrogeniformans]